MPDFYDHHHGLPERFTSASYFNAVPRNSTVFCIISHFHKHLMTNYASAKLKLGDAFLTYFCVFDQNVTSQGSLFWPPQASHPAHRGPAVPGLLYFLCHTVGLWHASVCLLRVSLVPPGAGILFAPGCFGSTSICVWSARGRYSVNICLVVKLINWLINILHPSSVLQWSHWSCPSSLDFRFTKAGSKGKHFEFPKYKHMDEWMSDWTGGWTDGWMHEQRSKPLGARRTNCILQEGGHH